MHLEILVEDQSGKTALEILLPKIVGESHSWKVISYKGIGRIPRNFQPTTDPGKRILLDQLPRLLRGYGKKGWSSYPVAVVVVCDLDAKCLKQFRAELLALWERLDTAPTTCFCIAVEEGEAWYLGDLPAIRAAYANAKADLLSGYINDSICGTWEKLADAIYPGGSVKLKAKGSQAVGAEKSKWAQEIAQRMDVDRNDSPSFIYFRDKLRALTLTEETEEKSPL